LNQDSTGETPAGIKGATTIDAKKAETLLNQGVKPIDVGNYKDWNSGHIPGAVRLELCNDFMESRLSEVAAKDEE
jgi:rhodanese-related sulfurtransferase